MARQGRIAGAELPTWSWGVSALGLALVVGTAGYMFYRAIANDSTPPEVVIEVDAVARNTNGYLVTLRVTNVGGTVAAGAVIEGALTDDATTVETSTITMDYIPSGSQRKAGLTFSRDPEVFDLRLRMKGYEQP